MVLSEARLEVLSSRLIGDVVLTVEDFSVNKLVIRNEGWEEVVNPSVEFTLTEPQSEDTVSLFAPVTHTVSLQNFSDIIEVPLTPSLPERLRGTSLVVVKGRIRYGQTPNQQVLAFHTRVSLQVRAAVGIPPSHYYDIHLKAGQSGVIEQIGLAQEIKPGEADHFVIRLGADKSSQHRIKLSFHTADGETFAGGEVLIDVFVPRTSGRILRAER